MEQLKFSQIAECVEEVMCLKCDGSGLEGSSKNTTTGTTCNNCKGTGIKPESNLGELLLLKKLQA